MNVNSANDHIIEELFWMQFDAEAGTLEYAELVQAQLGGVIHCDNGWYWVDGGNGTDV
jgi:hypothetical protein